MFLICVCVCLTIGDLQQSFSDHTSCDVERLAAVVAAISALHSRDGQITGLRDGEPAGGLRRLRGEQQVLQRRMRLRREL